MSATPELPAATPARSPEKQLILTERAHFMCPNMHFGILARLRPVFEPEKARAALEALAQAHPFLRSVIACEEDGVCLYYRVAPESRIVTDTRESDEALWAFYRAVGAEDWNVFENGLLKVCFCPAKEGFQALFVCHHLLGDGRCLLELVGEFARAYGGGEIPSPVEERLISGMDDLPKGSDLPFVSGLLVNRANRQWRKEARRLSYGEYAAFVRGYAEKNPPGYASSTLSRESTLLLKKRCRENGVSVNDWLMAKLYLCTGVRKIVIAADVRERLANYRPGAAGNYASAMGIVAKGRETDPIAKAKAVHALVQAALADHRRLMLVLACYLRMDPTLLDAAATAGLGGFESKAARFVGSGMFGFGKGQSVSLTNLGSLEEPFLEEAMFIPPASPAARETIGALTVNGVLRLCCSFDQRWVSAADAERLLSDLTDISQ